MESEGDDNSRLPVTLGSVGCPSRCSFLKSSDHLLCRILSSCARHPPLPPLPPRTLLLQWPMSRARFSEQHSYVTCLRRRATKRRSLVASVGRSCSRKRAVTAVCEEDSFRWTLCFSSFILDCFRLFLVLLVQNASYTRAPI